MSVLRTIEFLDASGHLALEWDPTNPADVERARADFATLRETGYTFFRVVAQEVDGFDPTFGRLEVRRVDASEVEPRLESPPETVSASDVPIGVAWAQLPRPRGRPPGSTNKPKEPEQPERVVAARPMRGG